MDLIGPFHPSTRGYRFVLVLVDYATRYPEAVPLHSISAKSMAQALFQVISRVGIPKEILTDQGTSFMSRTIKELYGLLGIKAIRTSAYHPQTDGLVERLNKTLKTMIRKVTHKDKPNWDKWLEPLMFAMREVPQASIGFTPFDLLYGRRPRGVLDIIKESWEEGPSSSKNEIQYVMDMRAKYHTVGHLSRENLLRAQERQQRTYNRGTRLRKFSPGEKVLVLLPTSSSKLLERWQGPIEVTQQVGDVDYEVRRSDRGGGTQIYHLNLLKEWREAEPDSMVKVVREEEELGRSWPEGGTVSGVPLVGGGRQVRPQMNKTAAIAACPPPKTKKEVRRFLGLAGFYRRFIPRFLDLTSPLTDLTRKVAPELVQWSEQCQRVFEKADASGRGLGAVLSQRVGGVNRPVLYISRKLSDRKARYSTVERECLAIRWAVGALRYYLLGRAFSLCSDHKPLQWLRRMKDANARITRRYLALQPYNFQVVHRPGAQMAVANSPRRGPREEVGAARRDGCRPETGGGGMFEGAWSTRRLWAGHVQEPAVKQMTGECLSWNELSNHLSLY
nr:uncharacterized protein LOC133570739 [Nerophis lumbriciformis]